MPVDIVILTALPVEYDAVQRYLVNPRLRHHPKGTLFEIGTARNTDCTIALGLVGKGNHSAATLTERAIEEFAPGAVLFVGVAGALWDIPLGDVVVATHVYAYHGATSEDDGRKARPRVWEATHSVTQFAVHLARDFTWIPTSPTDHGPITVRFGPIAAGEIVQNSRNSQDATWIRDHFNDAVAIEMEAAGVAQASHLNNVPFGIVRSISDRADGTKNTHDDADWQPRAAANAAAFAIRLATTLGKERKHAMTEKKDATANTIVNVAHGPVGIQAGGNVQNSTVVQSTAPQVSTPADLLVALRADLAREHANGTLDTDTYNAAQEELNTASDALAENTSEGRRMYLVALNRLREHVADIAGVAAKLVALFAALNELS